jgi:hypothetical protein
MRRRRGHEYANLRYGYLPRDGSINFHSRSSPDLGQFSSRIPSAVLSWLQESVSESDLSEQAARDREVKRLDIYDRKALECQNQAALLDAGLTRSAPAHRHQPRALST